MADISPTLKKLLIDDAHLRIARALVDEARGDLETRIEALRKTESSIDRLLALTGRPREISQQVKAARGELTKVEGSLASLDKVLASLEPRLEEETETHLRAHSPEYVKGLAAVKDYADWTGAIGRFQRKLENYLRALGTARNMLSAGYDRTQKRISAGADEALGTAILAATELEEETTFLNKVADAHEECVADTPNARAVLPRVPVASFREWTERLRQLSDIGEMQAEFARILAMCEMLQTTGVVALDEAVHRAVSEHSALSQGFVREYVKALRQFASERWVKHEETASRVQRLQREMLGFSNFPFEMET